VYVKTVGNHVPPTVPNRVGGWTHTWGMLEYIRQSTSTKKERKTVRYLIVRASVDTQFTDEVAEFYFYFLVVFFLFLHNSKEYMA
jgi:hypothetical protein